MMLKEELLWDVNFVLFLEVLVSPVALIEQLPVSQKVLSCQIQVVGLNFYVLISALFKNTFPSFFARLPLRKYCLQICTLPPVLFVRPQQANKSSVRQSVKTNSQEQQSKKHDEKRPNEQFLHTKKKCAAQVQPEKKCAAQV